MAQLPNPTLLTASRDPEDLGRRIGLALTILQEPTPRQNARWLAIAALMGIPVGGAILLPADDTAQTALTIAV
ncbi:hypothetical protein [Oerskovia paurometabola]|uniref:hypothetical protein n=1 Tax=Oerskovia paurometabola TaxID=162170 RepID=UPI00343B3F29